MTIIKKASLVLVGALVGAMSWQVGFAAVPIDAITVCHRPGADLRAPASSGSCPSGYTKTEISDGAPGAPGTPATNPAYVEEGRVLTFGDGTASVLVTSLELPVGSYTFAAHGRVDLPQTDRALVSCLLMDRDGAPLPGANVSLDLDGAVSASANGAFSTAAHLDRGGPVELRCLYLAGTDSKMVQATWQVVATQVSSVAPA